MAAVTQTAVSGVGFPLRLRAIVARVAEQAAARRLRKRQMRELTLFSDRELWDVGLSRSDFIAIEKGTFRRD